MVLWGTEEQACLCLRTGAGHLEERLERHRSTLGWVSGRGTEANKSWGSWKPDLGKTPTEQNVDIAIWPWYFDEAQNHLRYQLSKNYHVTWVAWNRPSWSIHTIEISKSYKSVRCALCPRRDCDIPCGHSFQPLVPRSLQNWLLSVLKSKPCHSFREPFPDLTPPPWAPVTWPHPFVAAIIIWNTYLLDYFVHNLPPSLPTHTLECKPPENRNLSDFIPLTRTGPGT